MTLQACDTLPELLAGHSSPTLRSRTVPHELISGFPFWGHPAPVVAGFTTKYTPLPSTASLPLEEVSGYIASYSDVQNRKLHRCSEVVAKAGTQPDPACIEHAGG